MKTPSKQFPLPYKAAPDPIGDAWDLYAEGGDGLIVAEDIDDKQTAVFIARACNSHEQLLKGAKSSWHLCQSLLACPGAQGEALIREIRDYLAGAIAEAEGKP